MKASIVIPTKNAGPNLSRLINGIEAQAVDFEVEVIVVDSGSRDDTVKLARSSGANIQSIPSRTFTHGGSRNAGASLAKGDFLVFCNQDVEPTGPEWLNNLLNPFSYSNVAMSYSRQVAPPDAPGYERIFLERVYPNQSRINSSQILRNRGPGEIVLFSTVAGAMRRSVWESNRFAEDIIMSEDQELAARVLISGSVVAYVADSVVYHYNEYTLSSAFRRYFDSGWSMNYAPHLKVTGVRRPIRFLIQQVETVAGARELGPRDRMKGLVHLLARSAGFQAGQMAPLIPAAIRERVSYTAEMVRS